MMLYAPLFLIRFLPQLSENSVDVVNEVEQALPVADEKMRRSGEVSGHTPRFSCRRYLPQPGKLLMLLVLGILVAPFRAAASEPWLLMQSGPVVPDRQIQQRSTVTVQWQALWLQARNAALQKNFRTAVPLYQQLLILKPDLEEACWELTLIWLRLEEPEKAAALLERLLEIDGDQVSYLNTLAFILQGKAYYSRSLDLFTRALKNEPNHIEALVGIVQSLVKLRRKEEALPYLKILHRLRPADRQFRRELATIAFETGDLGLARSHLVALAEGVASDIPLLEMTARAHERLGLENLAIPYHMRILASQPDHQESHDRLAWYYEKHGRVEEALYHFQVLLAKNPANPSFLHAIGRLLENSGRFAEALPYFERYLAHRPKDRKVLDTMVNLHAALGERAEMLSSMDRLLAVDPDLEPGMIKLAARLYDESGQPDKAIPLYRRILATNPEDREVVAALAVALSATGKANSALAMWRHLTELEPGRVEPYRAMAEILYLQQRHDELVEILERIHALDNTDELVALRLAAIYLERDEVGKGWLLLERIKESTPYRVEYLESLANYHEKIFQAEHALRAYEELLELKPDSSEIRKKCIQLAGELGKLSVLRNHLAVLEQGRSDAAVELLVGRALSACGVYDEALGRYQKLLVEGVSLAPPERQEILLEMAMLYRRAGLLYEAEQTLRMVLLLGGDISPAYLGLFELALESGAFTDAEIWLAQLRQAGPAPEHDLLLARLHSAKGEHRAAVGIARQKLAETAGIDADVGVYRQQFSMLFPARLLLAAGLLMEARHICLMAAEAGHPVHELERLVLLQQIAFKMRETAAGEQAHAEAMALAAADPGLLLHLGFLYQGADLPDQALRAAQQAVAAAPDSLRAWFLLIAAQQAVGKAEAALVSVRHITALHPGHAKAMALEATLFFKTGKYQEAEVRSGAISADNPYYPEQRQLKGRALWRLNRWQEALAVYEDFLSPPVARIFEEESEARGVLHLPEISRTTIWQHLSYREAESAARIDRVMAASSAVDNSSQRQRDLNAIATPLYASYRWQERFANELTARRSISRREYYLAIRQFENLLKTFPGDESLMFDLAGLYSHQGLPGEEAVLYHRIASLNPDFPGLNEAIERNHLKRRPRLQLLFDRRSEKGRDGKKAIRQDQHGIGGWFSPALQQEIDFAAFLVRYQSTEDERDLQARRAVFSYQTDFNSNISIRLGGGVEEPENDLPRTGLIDTKVTGRIGDKWRSYLSFARDVTTDTIGSLTRNIVRHDFHTGLGIDVLPRLAVGAEYVYTDFSDHNVTSGYEFWASYILLPEPTYLKVSYSYDFKDSRRGTQAGIPSGDGFAVDDPPYWTPVNYWVNLASIHFKHLLSKETFDRSIPRYYILEYSLGHDSEGEAIQLLKGSFFLEWTQRLLMEAAAEIISSEPYRQSGVSFSAIYRW
jgi:tetratricopeptide (TPR) repeat protein